MKTVLTLAVAASLSLLVGCSTLQQGGLYFADAQPTAATVAAAGGEQLYQDTVYKLADFNQDGSARTFAQYNFASESAPCSVIDSKFTGSGIEKNQAFYQVTKGSETFLFNCRSNTGNRVNYSAMRLYLIGSSADCAQHSNGGSNGSMSSFAQSNERACNGYRINNGAPTKTDVAYTKS